MSITYRWWSQFSSYHETRCKVSGAIDIFLLSPSIFGPANGPTNLGRRRRFRRSREDSINRFGDRLQLTRDAGKAREPRPLSLFLGHAQPLPREGVPAEIASARSAKLEGAKNFHNGRAAVADSPNESFPPGWATRSAARGNFKLGSRQQSVREKSLAAERVAL